MSNRSALLQSGSVHLDPHVTGSRMHAAATVGVPEGAARSPHLDRVWACVLLHHKLAADAIS